MRAVTNSLALAATARAAVQGFNYGNVFTDGRLKVQSDFEAEFKTAQGLEGTNGAFNSARLYTMIVSLAQIASWPSWLGKRRLELTKVNSKETQTM